MQMEAGMNSFESAKQVAIVVADNQYPKLAKQDAIDIAEKRHPTNLKPPPNLPTGITMSRNGKKFQVIFCQARIR